MTTKKQRQLIRLAQMHPDTPAIDLHGMHVYEAEHAVDRFLDRSFRHGEQVVKIIHGKGMEVLAGSVPEFVKSHPLVQYAEPAFGTHETGAVLYAVLDV